MPTSSCSPRVRPRKPLVGTVAVGLFFSFSFFFFFFCLSWRCVEGMGRVGAKEKIPDAQNDVQLEDLAKFAVDQHNSKENSDLEYVALVSAEQQVVAGIMYYLDLEAASGGTTKLYEAKVWVKSWENFKSLEDFKEKQSSVTPADRGTGDPGTNLDGPASTNGKVDTGLQPVSSDDPTVKEAAEEALKGIQERSNSLTPYELKKVLSAHKEVIEGRTSFDLLIDVQRGSKEEQFKAEVARTNFGAWTVKDVRLHH